MIVSKLCYMIRHNLNQFQNCYFRCLLDNYIIAFHVIQMMVVSKMLGMKMVKLLSVIYIAFTVATSFKKMSARYKIMCGCECCISTKSIHSSLLSWRDRSLEKIKDQSQNSQSRRSGQKAHHIYTTYKNTVMPHGSHIYAKASDMANDTMCTYPHSEHALPHWKCVLRCCDDCTCINIPDQETTKKMTKLHPQLGFTFTTSLDLVLLMVEFH